MTEREKIIKIIADNGECFPDIKKCAECKYKNAEEDCRPFFIMYKTADALIAAGIGDMSKQRLLVGKDGTVKQLYSGEEVEKIANERDEYKYHAEVAEKMFNILYEETSGYMKVLSKEWYKYQAEKELAEGKKR